MSAESSTLQVGDGLKPPLQSSAIHKPANWLDLLDWREVFAKIRPLEIDIGCGKGNFLAWAAGARPQHNFLGVERQLKRLRKVDKKVVRLGLTNVRLLRVEAGYFVSKLVPPNSVSVYHIYFPDPWPKRRHHRRRLFNESFVAGLHRTLVRGGVVNLATDDADYFQQVEKAVVQSGEFDVRPPEVLPDAARTEFEKIFLATGKTIYRSRYVRRD